MRKFIYEFTKKIGPVLIKISLKVQDDKMSVAYLTLLMHILLMS